WKNQQGQRQEKTTWHRCVLWGKPAESLNEYLVKGKQVAVEGRIDNREYEQDGVKKYISEIIVDRLTLLGGGNGQRNGGGSRQAGNEFGGVDDFEPPMEPITDDDIAF
ncbi:MAG: single-stranded DNA-binding protein, partial [Vicinamibacterales bacterium]